MNPIANEDNNMIEPVIRTLRQLSPGSQVAVASLVRQLAEIEGISVQASSC